MTEGPDRQPAEQTEPLAEGREPAEPHPANPAASFRVLEEHLRTAAARQPQVRNALLEIGRWLLNLGLEVPRSPGSTTDDGRTREAAEVPENEADAEPRHVTRTLSLGGTELGLVVVEDREETTSPPSREAPDDDHMPGGRPARKRASLKTVAERARFKAECCRWAIERRRRLADGADFDLAIKPQDDAISQRLRSLPDCYAWPIDPYGPLPDDDRELDDAAGCYEVLADAVELADQVRADEDVFEEYGQAAYDLLAESCSALRAILLRCGIERDNDQNDAFDWLRTRTAEDRIRVVRHMRLNDPADPGGWLDRSDAIEKVADEIDRRRSNAKERRNLLGKVGYAAKRWGDYDDERRLVETRKLDETVTRLVDLGLRPSDRELRDPLLAIADELPDIPLSGSFAEALRYADQHAARLEAEPRVETGPVQPPTPEVEQARTLLDGQVAVMIGGQCRPKSRDALRAGLGLKDLRWITTRPHESTGNFEAVVQRDEVAVVLLAIRWSSHSFEEIKTVCDRVGTPFVRLPRGYGLNQVAHEIMRQASEAITAWRRAHPPA